MSQGEPEPSVTLVIPGRNAAGTLRPCLEAVVPMLERGELAEIIFVDDGSTDETARIVAEFPVRCVEGPSRGPGAARNVGWRLAKTPLVWFLDSDCVASQECLPLLTRHLADKCVGGVGGGYENLRPDSLLASLIQGEISFRHRSMSEEVNFLGSYNVVYRRCVLEQVRGFDELEFNASGSPGAEDAELAFRVAESQYTLHFEPRSQVGHFHPTHLGRYLRSQRHHGYWRVFLYLRHPNAATGDSYSGIVDHVQPPLAMAMLAALPLLFWQPLGLWQPLRWMPVVLATPLLLAQVPMTLRLVRATRQPWYMLFALLGFVRAFARGLGMTAAVVRCFRVVPRSSQRSVPGA